MAKNPALAQADGINIPKRWALVNKLQTRAAGTPLEKDARLINCYAEYDPEDEEFWIYKRLGVYSTPYAGPISGEGRGIIYAPAVANWLTGGGQLFATWGDTVRANNSLLNGTLATSSGPVSYCVAPSGPGVVITDTSGYGYTAYPGAPGQVTAFVSGGYGPATAYALVPSVVFLDGTFYAMDITGTIWGSTIASNSPTGAWPSANTIIVQNDQSLGTGLARQLNYIIAMKQQSCQVFYDAGTTPCPLAPVPDAQLPFGCVNGWSVATMDECLFWMTSNVTSSPQIVQMINLTPKIVSWPSIDRILQNAAWTASGGVYGWTVKRGGHRWYFLTNVYLNITLVYDIDQQLWSVWTDDSGNYYPYSSAALIPPGVSAKSQLLIQHITDGYIWTADTQDLAPTDAGSLITVDIYAPNFDANTDRRKFLSALYPNTDQQTGGMLYLQYSDDDYQSWSSWRSCDLSKNKPRFQQCGTFRKRRALHLRHQSPTPFRIKSCDMQLLLGSL